MWMITHKHSGKLHYLTLGQNKYTVGRAGSDIVLVGDTSISRFHAALHVSSQELHLEDVGSKYGTYHNEKIESRTKIPKTVQITVNDGDRILFGALKNEWLVSKKNLITAISSLSETQINEINSYLKPIGGVIATKWNSSCTHLTMSEITITVKMLHALIDEVPIVSCEFWRDHLDNIRKNESPPKEGLYLPKKSVSLSSAIDVAYFRSNNERKTLFIDKIFIFMSRKHCEIYSPIVHKAGGACKDLNSSIPKKYLIKKNVIVVQYAGSTQTQNSQTANISEYLEINGLRLIPEYEIGLALVCCTIEKYCNPSYRTVVLPNTEYKSEEVGTLFAEYTNVQKSMPTVPNMSTIEIPDSDDSKVGSCSNKYSHSEIYENNSKNSEQISQETCVKPQNKRKRVEENDNIRVLKKLDSQCIILNKYIDRESSEIKPGRSGTDNQTNVKSYGCVKDHHSRSADDIPTSTLIDMSYQNVGTTNNKHISKLLSSHLLGESNTGNNKTDFQRKKNSDEKSIKITSGKESLRPHKRGRIARITDDNINNEDDIFNFGSICKKSKSTNTDSESELSDTDSKNLSRGKANENFTVINDCSKAVHTNTHSTSYCAKIKVSPMTITMDGWLSKLTMLTIKDEGRNELQTAKNKIEDTIKGFSVRRHTFTYSSKERSKSYTHTSSTSNSNISKTNFKKFVKKQNYKPQTAILRTVTNII